MAGVRAEAEKAAEKRIVELLMDQTEKLATERLKAQRAAARSAASARRRSGVAAAAAPPTSSGGASAGASVAESAAPLPSRRHLQTAHRILAEELAASIARHELDEQMIEIEVEPEESFPAMFEFVSGLASDEIENGLQDFLTTLPGGRRRVRQVSIKEARKLLTQEEANKLIDLESVVEQATQRAEQTGIVFLDEIDKVVGSKVDTGPDVSGEGVQRDLLPIIEGSTVATRYGPLKTDHVLWIAAGAFTHSKPSDLIPELQGRLPLRVELAPLGQQDYQRILTQPENALTRQYAALLSVEGVTLEFGDDGVAALAESAQRMNERVENIGARRLHTIMEKLLEDISFAASEHAGETLRVDAAFVRERLADLIADEDLSRYVL
jgi:ATP-dependent HslUV protease ATP-binding subunit HslU